MYIDILLLGQGSPKDYNCVLSNHVAYSCVRSCCGRDCMTVGFTTTYAISAYHH